MSIVKNFQLIFFPWSYIVIVRKESSDLLEISNIIFLKQQIGCYLD